jgi:hypothetical protein
MSLQLSFFELVFVLRRATAIENTRHNPAAANPVMMASPLKLAECEIPSINPAAIPVNAAARIDAMGVRRAILSRCEVVESTMVSLG